MTQIPQAAMDAATHALLNEHPQIQMDDGEAEYDVRVVLEAAAPHIAAAERERIRQLAACYPRSFWFTDLLTGSA